MCEAPKTLWRAQKNAELASVGQRGSAGKLTRRGGRGPQFLPFFPLAYKGDPMFFLVSPHQFGEAFSFYGRTTCRKRREGNPEVMHKESKGRKITEDLRGGEQSYKEDTIGNQYDED